MRAGRGKAQQDLARAHVRGIEDAVLLHDAHGESRKIVVVAAVHPGHLGGFAAGQGATRQLAALGDAPDDGFGKVDVEASGGEIVQEVEWFGAGDEDIVDAHRHQVDADGVVAIQGGSQFQFRADTVRSGDQHRVPVPCQGQLEQGAEAADGAQHSRSVRLPRRRTDPADEFVAGFDMHAAVSVAQRPVFGVAVGQDGAGAGKRGLCLIRLCSAGFCRRSRARRDSVGSSDFPSAKCYRDRMSGGYDQIRMVVPEVPIRSCGPRAPGGPEQSPLAGGGKPTTTVATSAWGEDASRVRKGHASTNNATLNNIVLTLETHCGFRYLPKVNQHFMMRHQG